MAEEETFTYWFKQFRGCERRDLAFSLCLDAMQRTAIDSGQCMTTFMEGAFERGNSAEYQGSGFYGTKRYYLNSCLCNCLIKAIDLAADSERWRWWDAYEWLDKGIPDWCWEKYLNKHNEYRIKALQKIANKSDDDKDFIKIMERLNGILRSTRDYEECIFLSQQDFPSGLKKYFCIFLDECMLMAINLAQNSEQYWKAYEQIGENDSKRAALLIIFEKIESVEEFKRLVED
jgi:hypothetical protein